MRSGWSVSRGSAAILREWRLCAEREAGARGEGGCREVLRSQLWPGRGGDQGGIVRRERERGKGDGQAPFCCCGGESSAQFAVRCDSAGDEQAVRAVVAGGGEGLALGVLHRNALEGREVVE